MLFFYSIFAIAAFVDDFSPFLPPDDTLDVAIMPYAIFAISPLCLLHTILMPRFDFLMFSPPFIDISFFADAFATP